MKDSIISKLTTKVLAWMFTLIYNLIKIVIDENEGKFFRRLLEVLETTVRADRLAVLERHRDRWLITYAIGPEAPQPGQHVKLPQELNYAIPAFHLDPTDGLGWDAYFAIDCKDGLPRVLAVDDTSSSRSFDLDEVTLFISIANMIAAMNDNKKLLKEDPLTGLPNRLTSESKMQAVRDRAIRYGHHFSVGIIDLDHFKAVNDTYGHDMGDKVLREVAKFLKHNLRNADFVGRAGGEEFWVVLDEADPEQAKMRLDDIQRGLKHLNFQSGDEVFQVSFTAGLCLLDKETAENGKPMIWADDALYAGKNAGRKRVVIWTPDTPSQSGN